MTRSLREAHVTPAGDANKYVLIAAALLALVSWGIVLNSFAPTNVAEEEKTILAVLPVRFSAIIGQDEFPVDGVTHAIIARLFEHNPETFAVIGRTSIRKYKDVDASLEQIGRELGAGMVLETTIGRTAGSETEYEASVSLVESLTGQVRWSVLADGSLNIIEDKIVSGLLAELGASQHSAIAERSYATVDPEAYEALIAGLHAMSKRNREGAEEGLAYFQKALSIEPDFDRAHVGVVRASTALGLPRAAIVQSTDRAIEINPRAAEAYYYKAISAFYSDWDFEAAERNFKRAIELRPGDPRYHAMYSNFLRSMRRFDEAGGHGDIALELDPLSEISVGDYEWQFLAQGNYEQAIRFCERALNLRLEDRDREYRCLMLANYELARFDAAADYALKIIDETAPENSVRTTIQNLAGKDRVEAVWRLELEKNIADENTFSRYFQIARGYVSLGEFENALEALDKSVKAHETAIVYIAQDPTFIKLKNEPRYQAILKSVNLPSVDSE